MDRRPRLLRAFTLIEAMIVVVLVGVLATIATVAYQKWIRSARLGEAEDMVAQMRSAEQAYFAENGNYLNVSRGLGLGNLYPAATPGAFKTQWGATCLTCNNPNGWAFLQVSTANPVLYGYAVVAGTAAAAPSYTITVNGTSVNLTPMAGQPWYIVQAMGDSNGDSVFTTIYGFSNTNQLMIDREGE